MFPLWILDLQTSECMTLWQLPNSVQFYRHKIYSVYSEYCMNKISHSTCHWRRACRKYFMELVLKWTSTLRATLGSLKSAIAAQDIATQISLASRQEHQSSQKSVNMRTSTIHTIRVTSVVLTDFAQLQRSTPMKSRWCKYISCTTITKANRPDNDKTLHLRKAGMVRKTYWLNS